MFSKEMTREWDTVDILFTSLQTISEPKTTCRPSKKFSPITTTLVPPVVQPSFGQMALMHGATIQ